MSTIVPLPTVTIVVRTLGKRLRLLRGALESLNRQVRPPIEVIVVEDGSSIAGEIVTDANKAGVTVFRHLPIERSGRSAAANRGLQVGVGEVLGLLDEDDELYPNHIELLSAALQNAPAAELVYARADIRHCRRLAEDEEVDAEAEPAPPFSPFSRTRLWFQNQFPIQSALFRRSLFEREGGFDSKLEFLEDWDLWIRYSARREFLALQDVTSVYRLSKDPKELEARAALHNPWTEVVFAKHRDLAAEHRFEDVVSRPDDPSPPPTFRQAFGLGRRALLHKFRMQVRHDQKH